MNATDTTANEVIHLRYDDEGRVVVCPEDQDRFVLTKQEAAFACAVGQQQLLWGQQLHRLLNRLGQWLSAHADKVGSAWLSRRDSRLLFLVVRNSVPYDDAFEDELLDLYEEVFNSAEYALLRLDTLALPSMPKEATTAFTNPSFRWEYVRAKH